MSLIKEVAGELVGMFLGDLRLATAVIALIAATAALVDLAAADRMLGGGVLLGGCLLILIESVRHAARPRAPR